LNQKIDSLLGIEIVANSLNQKDTVPPQKSQTRGNPTASPILVRNASIKLNKATNAEPKQKEKETKSGKGAVRALPVVKKNQAVAAKPKIRMMRQVPPPNPKGRRGGTLFTQHQGLPGGSVAKGLRMPAISKKGVSFDINQRLKAKSPWFLSIQDPLHGADAKIPDEVGVDTGTLQLVQKFTVASGVGEASGVAGFRIFCPYVNSVPNGQASPLNTAGANYQTTDPLTATDHTIRWGAVGSTGSWVEGSAYPFQNVAELKSVTDMHRIVSAGLYVQPEPSLSSNQGEFTMFVNAFDITASPLYDTYMNHYKSSTIPINTNKAGVALWYPVERQYSSFKSFFTTNGDNLDTVTFDENSIPPWEIGFVASGLDATTTITFRVTVCINYEFVPISNTLNVIDSSPSPNDAQEVDLVENWVQDMDITKIVGQRQVSVAPAAVEIQHGENDAGTGFGMAFNVMKELLPFAAMLL